VTAPAPVAGACPRDDCTISSGGTCARGFEDPFSCEDFEPEEPPTADDGGNSDPEVAQGDPARDPGGDPLDARGRRPWQQSGEVEHLHSGEALTLEEATRVRQGHHAAVAVPVGEVDVGKTTMLAALFEALGAVSVGGWAFAGSLSLMGFEARSHDAMVDSGRSEPVTLRTSQNTDQVLLHLALIGSDQTRRHLLLADVSGEHAESLRLHNDPGDYADLLKAATCVMLMVDGERLADPAKRHAETTKVRTLFRAINENHLLAEGASVLVVVTKWDLCAGSADDITPGLDKLIDTIRQASVTTEVLRLAARPATTAPINGTDSFDALLERLLRLPSRRGPAPAPKPAPGRPSHAFTAGSAVMDKYLKAAP
jgi:hypothetical protein